MVAPGEECRAERVLRPVSAGTAGDREAVDEKGLFPRPTPGPTPRDSLSALARRCAVGGGAQTGTHYCTVLWVSLTVRHAGPGRPRRTALRGPARSTTGTAAHIRIAHTYDRMIPH